VRQPTWTPELAERVARTNDLRMRVPEMAGTDELSRLNSFENSGDLVVFGAFIQGKQVGIDKTRVEQQIFGRIAGQGQLGCADNMRALCRRLLHGMFNFQ